MIDFRTTIVPATGCGVTILICSVVIEYKRYKSRDEVQPFDNGQDGHNASILGSYGALIISIVLTFLIAPFIHAIISENNFPQHIAPFMFMMIFFVPSIIMPSIFFILKPKIFKSAVVLFKEALNC